MGREIPENTVGRKVFTLRRNKLVDLIQQLDGNADIVKIEIEPDGGQAVVTVHYAVMDLALKLGSINYAIEKVAKELDATHVQ